MTLRGSPSLPAGEHRPQADVAREPSTLRTLDEATVTLALAIERLERIVGRLSREAARGPRRPI
jgi:hypothetical protein